MCELFRDLNTSESLKGQERRQARITNLACFIRATSEKFKKVFFKMLSKIDESAFDQRKVDQFIAEIAVKLSNNYKTALDSNQLDKLYEEVEILSEDNEKKINFALLTLEKISKEMEEGFSGIDFGPAHAFIEVCFLTYEMGYRIKDHKKFFEWFLKGNADFTMKSLKVLQFADNKESEVSYKYWVQRPTQSGAYKKLSAVWANNLRGSLDHFNTTGVVNRIRTHKDTFSFDQKLEALVKQKYKDRNGDDISILDLYTKNKLHADHVKSVNDGGQTVLTNCEIMKAKDNLAKGSNSWEPHFDHQVEQKKASINS
jgi:CRISPR/Cas system CSM-associated protein Csm2 small subunit